MNTKRHFKISESLLRLLADFAMIHLSMLAAIAVSVWVELHIATPGTARKLAAVYFSYYVKRFVLLSLLFPMVFLLHGFYTRSRLYTSRYKVLITMQGVTVAFLAFVVANFLLFRKELIPRRGAVLFACFAIISISFARVAKGIFLRYFQISPRFPENGAAASNGNHVLVVGGAGYIGSLLVRRLLDMGKSVRVLDSLVYGDEAIQSLRNHPRFELMTGDCRDIQRVVSAVRDIDSIVHLAAIVGDPACEQDRQSALEINYAATRMMIEIAKGHGVRQFVFASSCSVYGSTEYIADEKARVSPISLYAQTKVDSEHALIEAASDSFSPVILRFATVFGHSWRPRFDLVVNLLTAKAFQESVITIFNGEQWRPFIHVRDVTEAIVKVLAASPSITGGQIYNVGDSRSNYTLSQVAEKIRAHFPGTRVEHVENSDKRNYRVSFEKVKQQLGFERSIDLDEGIAELHEAFASGAVLDYADVRYHNQKFLQRSGILPPPHELDGEVMAAFAKRPMTSAAAAS